MAGTLVFSFDFIRFHFFFFFFAPSTPFCWCCLMMFGRSTLRYENRSGWLRWIFLSFSLSPPLSPSLSRVCMCYTVPCVTVLCHKKKWEKSVSWTWGTFFFLFFLFSLSLLEKTKRKKLFFSFFLFLFLINFLCDILSSFHCDFISYHLTQDSKSQHLC